MRKIIVIVVLVLIFSCSDEGLLNLSNKDEIMLNDDVLNEEEIERNFKFNDKYLKENFKINKKKKKTKFKLSKRGSRSNYNEIFTKFSHGKKTIYYKKFMEDLVEYYGLEDYELGFYEHRGTHSITDEEIDEVLYSKHNNENKKLTILLKGISNSIYNYISLNIRLHKNLDTNILLSKRDRIKLKRLLKKIFIYESKAIKEFNRIYNNLLPIQKTNYKDIKDEYDKSLKKLKEVLHINDNGTVSDNYLSKLVKNFHEPLRKYNFIIIKLGFPIPNKSYKYRPTNPIRLRQIIVKLMKNKGIDVDLNNLISTDLILDMGCVFRGLNFKGKINEWNTSNVIDMTSLFYDSSFNGDISQWNTSNVIYMHSMFRWSKFNQNINGWNVEKVKTTKEMFFQCEFNKSINQWQLYNLEDASKMFEYNKVYNKQLFEALWDLSPNMSNMFEASKIKADDLIPWWYED